MIVKAMCLAMLARFANSFDRLRGKSRARRAPAEIDIGISTRIGLSHKAHRLLRFYARDNCFVSGPKRLNR